MRREDIVRRRHMLEAIADAQNFKKRKNQGDLQKDRMLLFALVRCVEIVGEAASSMSEETRVAAPDIPWAAIVGMRNRLVHAYFDVDTDILWKTVTVELPALATRIEALPEHD